MPKEVADQLHLQIQALIEIRPPVTKTTVVVPCTLHWLAHQLYDDMNRAGEIRRLNPALENPAVLRPGMKRQSDWAQPLLHKEPAPKKPSKRKKTNKEKVKTTGAQK